MKEKFTVCPSCGAVGLVGETCEYCGTQIVAKEETATYEERIVSKRTINPMTFAQKVSVFKNVGEYICNCAVVSMGHLSGVINLNGDFIFPLEYGRIKLYDTGYAYLQKGSDRFLFDLTSWKRVDFHLPLYSEESGDHKNIPDRLDKVDYGEYYSLTLYWEWYDRTVKRSYLLDKNNSLAYYTEGGVFERVETGFITRHRNRHSCSSYYDIRLKKLFHSPDIKTELSSEVGFTSKEGKLAMLAYFDFIGSSHFFPLDIDGKSAEDIQKEINGVAEKFKDIYRREKARAEEPARAARAAHRQKTTLIVVCIVLFFLGVGLLAFDSTWGFPIWLFSIICLAILFS